VQRKEQRRKERRDKRRLEAQRKATEDTAKGKKVASRPNSSRSQRRSARGRKSQKDNIMGMQNLNALSQFIEHQ